MAFRVYVVLKTHAGRHNLEEWQKIWAEHGEKSESNHIGTVDLPTREEVIQALKDEGYSQDEFEIHISEVEL